MSQDQSKNDSENNKPTTLVPTADRKGRRIWLYPDRRSGFFSRLRRRLAILLIAVYAATPWITVSNLPVVRIDMSQKSFFVLGQVFQFSELIYLFFFLLSLALILFLSTAMWGRVWCGFACPQTVFLDWLVRPIEEWIEGDFAHRKHNDSAKLKPLSHYFKKVLKHFIFFILAFLLANTALAYFFDAHELLLWMTSSPKRHPGPFVAMIVVTAFLYYNFAFFREQFCSFLCPYARFQSVMVDENTPAVAFDYNRGEPRGKKAAGDCIDCGLCVRVCPTGIDIRNGLQLECIQCLRCADACDQIMTNLKRPSGLIRLESEQELKKELPKKWYQRKRILVYAAALTLIAAIVSGKMLNRYPVEISFIRQPGTIATKLDNGRLANMFTILIMNKKNEEKKIHLEMIDPSDADIICTRCQNALSPLERARAPVMFTFDRKSSITTFRFRDSESGREFELPALR